MATQKPISTISYNSESFLRERLENWKKAHIIQAYMYIKHKGEEGDKDHIHLRIEPNRKLDPMELADLLKEYQIGKEKPLGVRPFRPSKEEDWILYAVHDEKYLAMKYAGGESREKLPYDWHEIQVPDDYDLETAWIRAKASLNHSAVNMATRLQQGANPTQLILEGENPFLVNALSRSMASNDYIRVTKEYHELQERFKKLQKAVEEAGFAVVADDNGNIRLQQGENVPLGHEKLEGEYIPDELLVFADE